MREFSLTFPTPPHTPKKKRLSHYLSSKGLVPLLPLVPRGLASNPALNILLLVVKLNLWNSWSRYITGRHHLLHQLLIMDLPSF